MGKDSTIEWCHHTFNPWWGCARVSPGCERCYAETFSKRVGHKLWGVQAERRFFGDKHWAEPLKWNAAAVKAGERHRVFCASMADVFEDRRDLVAERLRLCRLIEATPGLDWLLLTKRIENAASMLVAMFPTGVPRNVWAGTTVEDQRRADERLPILIALHDVVAITFVSAEPLLGPVKLDLLRLDVGNPARCRCGHGHGFTRCPNTGAISKRCHYEGCTCDGFSRQSGSWSGVDWIIAGGESGHGARPMHPDWARSLRDQCSAAGVPFLFKQWGEWSEIPYDHESPPGDRPSERYVNAAGGHGFHGEQVVRISSKGGKKAQGRLLDGRTWDGYPTTEAK